MKIGVLGTGAVGTTIGTKLVQLGHVVMRGPALRPMRKRRRGSKLTARRPPRARLPMRHDLARCFLTAPAVLRLWTL